jgi:hypothetical protein
VVNGTCVFSALPVMMVLRNCVDAGWYALMNNAQRLDKIRHKIILFPQRFFDDAIARLNFQVTRYTYHSGVF